jgi:hypothetical protein
VLDACVLDACVFDARLLEWSVEARDALADAL